MDYYLSQIQLIKSQIYNMKFRIDNIEMQYYNKNIQFQGEQLINLGIQMLNSGLNSFNLGKNKIMTSLDMYISQLKNISNQIINMIKNNEMIQQQFIHANIMQQQQQLMQQQMMNQLIFNNVQEEVNSKPKMNITFEVFSTKKKFNLICEYGLKIKEVLDQFSIKCGKPKNNFYYLFNGKRLDYDDKRKIENVFQDIDVINALEI